MVTLIYMVLATAMFFLQDTYFFVGGVEFSLKNPCALAILFLAVVNVTATVRIGRILVLARHMLTQMFPYLVPFFFSAVIWVGSKADGIAIINGIGMILHQLMAVCVAGATLYLFGSKGIWYCLGAMCAANILLVFMVIRDGGLGEFLREFYVLLTTFSGETGPLMQRLEIHDLTFALGPFLIYLFVNRKESPRWLIWLVLVTALFLVGLKRIAVPAVILGILVAVILKGMPDKAARQTASCAAAGMMLLAFLYIVGIRSGLFQYMEEKLQINTMGRVAMFRNLDPYYDISITFLGRGTGFERFVDWASGRVYQTPRRWLMQIHNDFLRIYLNIGFWGFWVWLWGCVAMPLGYWFRVGGKKAGCLFFGISIYCFALYATDNAIYYPYTLLAASLVPMSYHLEQLEEKALDKQCCRWCERGGEIFSGRKKRGEDGL